MTHVPYRWPCPMPGERAIHGDDEVTIQAWETGRSGRAVYATRSDGSEIRDDPEAFARPPKGVRR